MEPESSPNNITDNEKGFVLVASLMILLILIIIGVSATTNTTIELQIAGNDKAAKKTFYKADGGTELAAEALEHNIACTGFNSTRVHGLYIETPGLNFWQNDNTVTTKEPVAGDRDICFPGDSCDDVNKEVTSISLGGESKHGRGAAIQQHAGYEGKGKGAGGSGSYMLYDIYSRYQDSTGSDATVRLQWRHNIGQEGTCYY
ncbi:MAG: pilus assembly PilX N-terminal domain-containing protein [Desulfurivibrionaceae bacterium]